MPAKRKPKAVPKKPAKKARQTGKKPAPRITPKQEKFAQNYIKNGGNGTQAARDAGYSGDDNTLAVTAHDNLRNPKIQKFVRQRLEGLKATGDEVVNLLSDHMRGDMADLEDAFEADGSLSLKKAKMLGVSHLIKKLKTHSFTDEKGSVHNIVTVELYNSQAAANTLAKINGLHQHPRENDADVERRKKFASEALKRVMDENKMDEQTARDWMREHTPNTFKYLM